LYGYNRTCMACEWDVAGMFTLGNSGRTEGAKRGGTERTQRRRKRTQDTI
jgi:hypothetical protein